jgi:Carboxypeptidase regulatory-like domain/TonB-dependent Receptor Plug Domain
MHLVKTSILHQRRFAGFGSASLMAFLLLLANMPAQAQEITGIISGTVTDPSDAVVPGAAVKLTLDATGESKAVSTEATGAFTFLNVLPGQYTLSISAQGFKGLERKNINLTSSERMALGRIALQVGAATESVTVVDQGAAVQTESSERSSVITSAQMSDLSSLTRAWTTYLLTIPSVYADGGDGSSPSIAGQPASSNTIIMDGIGGDGENGGPRFRVNLDTIAELHVIEANPPAEYGNHPGAVINIVTKSGTRDFHGAGPPARSAWSGTPGSRYPRRTLSSPIRRPLASRRQSRRGTRMASTPTGGGWNRCSTRCLLLNLQVNEIAGRGQRADW